MKKYFAKMNHLNNPKNKAENAVQEFAKSVNLTLIYGEAALEQYVQQFRNKVAEINKEFPRCMDIDTESREYKHSGSLWVSASDVASINFSVVENEFPAPGRDPIFDLMGNMKADAE